MNVILLLRIIGVLLFYDAFISAVKTIQQPSGIYLSAIIVLSIISVGIANKFNKNIFIRILFSLIPLASVVFIRNTTDAFILLLPFAYVLITNYTERYEVHYHYLQSMLKVLLALNVIMTLYAFKYDINNFKIYMFCYLSVVTLIFATRTARMGKDHSITNASMDIIMMIAVCLISLIGVAFIWVMYKFKILTLLIELIGAGLGSIALFMASIYVKYCKRVNPGIINKQPELKEPPVIKDELSEMLQSVESEYQNPANRIIGLIIMALIAIAVVWFLYNMFMPYIKAIINDMINIWFDSKNNSKKENDTVTITKFHMSRAAEKKSKGNAAKIRKAYKEYLKYLSSLGQFRNQADTSLDILNRSCEKREKSGFSSERIALAVENEKELRELYLKARYAEDNLITSDDVKMARSLVKQLIN